MNNAGEKNHSEGITLYLKRKKTTKISKISIKCKGKLFNSDLCGLDTWNIPVGLEGLADDGVVGLLGDLARPAGMEHAQVPRVRSSRCCVVNFFLFMIYNSSRLKNQC